MVQPKSTTCEININKHLSVIEPIRNRWLALVQQAVKFAGAGSAGTLVHYLVLAFLLKTMPVAPVQASGAGMIAGAVIVYILNYHVTFHSTKKHKKVLGRFLPMFAAGFTLNCLILHFFLDYAALPVAASQLLATAGQFVCGFLISRVWVF